MNGETEGLDPRLITKGDVWQPHKCPICGEWMLRKLDLCGWQWRYYENRRKRHRHWGRPFDDPIYYDELLNLVQPTGHDARNLKGRAYLRVTSRHRKRRR